MLRIGRMTDYGIVLLSLFVKRGGVVALTARDLSAEASLPLPTVSKILKTLCRAGVLVSHRGVNGGYQLAQAPEMFPVSRIIEVFEGPIGFTECSSEPAGVCELQNHCPVRGPWRVITQRVRGALDTLTLANMVDESIPVQRSKLSQPEAVSMRSLS